MTTLTIYQAEGWEPYLMTHDGFQVEASNIQTHRNARDQWAEAACVLSIFMAAEDVPDEIVTDHHRYRLEEDYYHDEIREHVYRYRQVEEDDA